VCDLETSRIGAPYIYDISSLRVKGRKRTAGVAGYATEENKWSPTTGSDRRVWKTA